MVKNRLEKIEIAFCFDEKMYEAACVAIASLLDYRHSEDHYHISCVCDQAVISRKMQIQDIIKKRDQESCVSFYDAGSTYADGYEARGISRSTYLRLALHDILHSIDRVIYADVDVLFQDTLAGIWEIDLTDNFLAGVLGANNFTDTWTFYKKTDYYEEVKDLQRKYINAGIVLMDLNTIRHSDLDTKWKKMAQKKYHYQDQDILNITCKNRIGHIPLKYNVAAHLIQRDFMKYVKEKMYTKKECRIAYKMPAVIHYTGEKPWNNRGVHRGKVWWRYVDSQEDLINLFDKEKIKNKVNYGIRGRINRHIPF